MDNIQDNNTMPEGMLHIQRLASTLNDDPVSVAAITFDFLRNATNGFNAKHVVFLLVSIANNELREYMKETVFDAIRMNNDLLSSDMRMNNEALENGLDEIWRQVTVQLHYAERQKARRNAVLRKMLEGENVKQEIPQYHPKERKVEKELSISVVVNNSQNGFDNRRISMSGDDSTYNEK